MPHRFLIVGATGYTGRAVVQCLRHQNIETIAHIRPNSPNLEESRSFFSELGAEVDTTPWDRDSFETMLKNPRPALRRR